MFTKVIDKACFNYRIDTSTHVEQGNDERTFLIPQTSFPRTTLSPIRERHRSITKPL